MKIKLLLCLFAALASGRAANYVGDQIFSAPFTLNEGVNVVGNLTLATPGTYSAANWNVVGFVRFSAPGTYTVTATGAGISFAGNVVGPVSGGGVTVYVNYRTTVNFVGTVAPNITVVDNAAPPPVPADPVTPPPDAPLVNLSTRVTIGAGGTMSTGFVIGGSQARRVLVRAIGPGLAQFGVSTAMANPTLAVYKGAVLISSNDDWGGGAGISAVFVAVGAFGLSPASSDAALLLTLPPGAYSVLIKGASAADAGEVMAEVYLVE